VKIAADLAAKGLEETYKNEEYNILLATKAINRLYFVYPGP
jgi:hypothetical protein